MARKRYIYPGEILREHLIGCSLYRLAQVTKMPQSRLSLIAKGKRRITADTAIRLGIAFGTTAEFWLNLQAGYDIVTTRIEHGSDYAACKHISP